MSRFYASIQGNRGEATRVGSAVSGMTGHVRGWNIGARVTMQPDCNEPDVDVCSVCLTSGSSSRGHSVNVGTFRTNGKNSINPAILKDTRIARVFDEMFMFCAGEGMETDEMQELHRMICGE